MQKIPARSDGRRITYSDSSPKTTMLRRMRKHSGGCLVSMDSQLRNSRTLPVRAAFQLKASSFRSTRLWTGIVRTMAPSDVIRNRQRDEQSSPFSQCLRRPWLR